MPAPRERTDRHCVVNRHLPQSFLALGARLELARRHRQCETPDIHAAEADPSYGLSFPVSGSKVDYADVRLGCPFAI